MKEAMFLSGHIVVEYSNNLKRVSLYSKILSIAVFFCYVLHL